MSEARSISDRRDASKTARDLRPHQVDEPRDHSWENSALEANIQIPSPQLQSHFYYHRWRATGNLLIALVCTVMLGTFLAGINLKRAPQWGPWISLITIATILSTIIKSCVLSVVDDGVERFKWIWFAKNSRPSEDLGLIDRVGKGVMQALTVLWKMCHRRNAFWFGALLVVLIQGSVSLHMITYRGIKVYVPPNDRNLDMPSSSDHIVTWADPSPLVENANNSAAAALKTGKSFSVSNKDTGMEKIETIVHVQWACFAYTPIMIVTTTLFYFYSVYRSRPGQGQPLIWEKAAVAYFLRSVRYGRHRGDDEVSLIVITDIRDLDEYARRNRLQLLVSPHAASWTVLEEEE